MMRLPQLRLHDKSLLTCSMGLLADVDAALNEIYNLNDNKVEAMDNSLVGIVGEGVDDLQDAIVV